MFIKGELRKLEAIHTTPVEYELVAGDGKITLNPLLGKVFRFRYVGQIFCVACGKKTSRSFFNGYCYRCFTTLPETEEDVLHPEKCRAHLGIARDMEWAEKNCLVEHKVYLAETSEIKVGVTRIHNVPARWIDQGALQTIVLASTPNRYLAGMIEVALKQHLPDKTHWKSMLNKHSPVADLTNVKQKAISWIPEEYQKFISNDDRIFTFEYPLKKQTKVVASLNPEKQPEYAGVLTGIHGQYLIFDDGTAFNLRNYSGYSFEIDIFDV